MNLDRVVHPPDEMVMGSPRNDADAIMIEVQSWRSCADGLLGMASESECLSFQDLCYSLSFPVLGVVDESPA